MILRREGSYTAVNEGTSINQKDMQQLQNRAQGKKAVCGMQKSKA